MPAQPNPLRLQRDEAIFQDREAGLTWAEIAKIYRITQANAYIAAKRHAARAGVTLRTAGPGKGDAK